MNHIETVGADIQTETVQKTLRKQNHLPVPWGRAEDIIAPRIQLSARV